MHRIRKVRLCVVFSCLMSLLATVPVLANEAPTARQIEKYKADGSYAERVARAHEIGNDRFAPSLVARANERLRALAGLPVGALTPPPASQGLPTTGTPKVFVLLVDFPDYPHSASQTQADVDSKFFGAGDPELYPFESLQQYYQRSSYDQLEIQGTVFAWYTTQYDRAVYESMGMGPGQEAVMMEALDHANSQGHDFSQYDNNGDGTIDSFFVKWTGPDNGWAEFWWAYQWVWHVNTSYTIDGKSLDTYVWSWISNPEGGSYEPQTDIHETGHALGLPDYYDYDDTVGPQGGVGGLDMMHANNCDHNCFSKFMLDWLSPVVVSSGATTLALNPSGTSQDCVLIMPDAAPGDVFGEYFMAQYRKAGEGNDPYYFPNDGLVVWHIDATLDEYGWEFAFDNSYTSHKLLRLMEADGFEDIEYGYGYADAGDFYVPPATFGPATTPDSHDYAGADTHVLISGLTTPAETAGARFSVETFISSVQDDRTAGLSARIDGNQPNPFNPQTTINFSLASAQHVQLSVYDMAGRRVSELADREFDAGPHAVRWNGCDDSGAALPSGSYLASLRTEDGVQTAKMVLVR